jgi:multidrug efflux pump subunit AcrA (membrane-fusion protein)
MVKGWILAILSIIGFISAARVVTLGAETPKAPPPYAESARSPYPVSIAGTGIIEASSENLYLSPGIAGIVEELHVEVGSKVNKEDVLLAVDSKRLTEDINGRQAAVYVAKEDVKVSRSEVNEAAALFRRSLALRNARVTSEEESEVRRYGRESAEARLGRAESLVVQAESALAASMIERERGLIRAPVDGTVLQLNARVGEFIQPSSGNNTAAILFGDISSKYVRVDIDENDAWRFKEGAKARATLRGNSKIGSDLTFVRREPFIIPKVSLSGSSTERTDVRVLQVIYRIVDKNFNGEIGSQVEVYIESLT